MTKPITAAHFEQAMSLVCQTTNYSTLKSDGLALIANALGKQHIEYLPALDKFFRRLRELSTRPSYGPGRPTVKNVEPV